MCMVGGEVSMQTNGNNPFLASRNQSFPSLYAGPCPLHRGYGSRIGMSSLYQARVSKSDVLTVIECPHPEFSVSQITKDEHSYRHFSASRFSLQC
jgi:hypothetical protein